MKIKVLKALVFLCLTASCFGQVSVVLAPIPKFASVTQSGLPNANGCVFTFASGTTNSIPSYTDYTGNTLNQNPVILRPDGTANIWLAAGTVYRFVVKTFGGVNCASGSTVYTVDGIANGSSLNVTAVPFSGTPQFTVLAQNQLFTMTVTGNVVMLPLVATAVQAPAFITFQITQNSVGGYTWTWPANVIGGAPIGLLPNQVTTQEFIWNGTNATAVGPAILGSGPALSSGSISINSGTPLVTSNQSGTGNICMTTGCQLVNPTINGTSFTHSPVQTICADGTPTNVNAGGGNPVIVKTCTGIVPGALNFLNKQLRVSGWIEPSPSGNLVNMTVLLGFGPTTSLGTNAQVMHSSLGGTASSVLFDVFFTATCTTTAIGVTGQLTCVGFYNADPALTGSTAQQFNTAPITLNLTGQVDVGTVCSFTASPSASDTCMSNLITVEQLN